MKRIQIDWLEVISNCKYGPILVVHYSDNRTLEFAVVQATIENYIPGGIEVWWSPTNRELKLTEDRFREFIETWLLVREHKQAA